MINPSKSTMIPSGLLRNAFQRGRWSRWACAGLLASGSLLAGTVPTLSSVLSLEPSLDHAAIAQSKRPAEATSEDVANFVRSALAMEPKRKQAAQEIRAVMSRVPVIRCDNDESFTALDPRVRGVAIKYCNESKRIVESNGLSVGRFNELLMMQRDDTRLQQRIQVETCRFAPDVCKGR